MRLRTKLLLILIPVFLALFSAIEFLRYISIRNSVLTNMHREAKDIRSILMATRRVYHHQFLSSGIELTDKTLGFLPAHAMGRISSDFKNWTTGELYFNNVSDRPRNPKNAADLVEMEAINYFRKNPDEMLPEAPKPVIPAVPAGDVDISLDIIDDWCKSCNICVRLCPERCLELDELQIVRLKDQDACTGCRLCEWLCPDFAITVNRVRLDDTGNKDKEAA